MRVLRRTAHVSSWKAATHGRRRSRNHDRAPEAPFAALCAWSVTGAAAGCFSTNISATTATDVRWMDTCSCEREWRNEAAQTSAGCRRHHSPRRTSRRRPMYSFTTAGSKMADSTGPPMTTCRAWSSAAKRQRPPQGARIAPQARRKAYIVRKCQHAVPHQRPLRHRACAAASARVQPARMLSTAQARTETRARHHAEECDDDCRHGLERQRRLQDAPVGAVEIRAADRAKQQRRQRKLRARRARAGASSVVAGAGCSSPRAGAAACSRCQVAPLRVPTDTAARSAGACLRVERVQLIQRQAADHVVVAWR